jgi:probable phosphoglycerate mutase
MAGFEVWLARHGETEWSRSKRHTGRTDIPLTAHGHEQARKLAPTLDGHDFSRVLCSPLQRARQTCEEAGLLGRAELRDELMEWDYGDYEGRTTAEIQAELQPGWLLWTDGCPGGESAEQVAERVDRVIGELRDLEGDSIVFAHGHVLRVFAARWIEQSPVIGQRITLATGTLSRLGLEHDYAVIRAWNAPV